MNEATAISLENKKEEINVKLLGSHFPNISEDNPVKGREVLGFLKLNSPEDFISYSHKKYDEFLIEKYGSTDYLLDRINKTRKYWEWRQHDKEKLSAKNFGELKIEGIDDYLKEQKLNLTSDELRGILRDMIGDDLLSELNVGRTKFSNKYLLDDMSVISKPLTEEEFLADPKNTEKKSRGGTYPEMINKVGDNNFVFAGKSNDISFFSLKYDLCPSYLAGDKDWAPKSFTSGFLHELLHCAVNDKLTIEEVEEYQDLIKAEGNEPVTEYVGDFRDGKRGGSFIEEQLAELGRLYVLDYDSVSKKFPKQTGWFAKKFPTIKKDYLKQYFSSKEKSV
jgi:hypothetical protein